MPIYEYSCEKENGGCGHKFDELQKFSDPLLTVCPICKKHKLVKMMGSPTFMFTGTGFYETDYKRQETPPSTEA